jgi:gamma-glutamylcyclotransferase (GGCT)/AIG2-like uncharacterized protein YtfP
MSSPESCDRLFVYGTLRPGQNAYDLLAPHVRDVRPATATGTMLAFETYPGLVDGDTAIVGDVVTLIDPDAAFARLDAYEGDEFRRVLVDIQVDGAPARAWCYLLVDPDPAGATPVRSGDWARHDSQNR